MDVQSVFEEFQERAAICEFDGRMTRQAAEAMAYEQIAKKYGEQGVIVVLDATNA